MTVVGEASTGREALPLCRRLQPALILMDLNMPEMGGHEAIEEIRKICPKSRIVVFTADDGAEDIYRATRSGAAAYVLKDSPMETLVDAIRTVISGRTYIPPKLAAIIIARTTWSVLTPPEEQILALLAKGSSTKQIASEIGIPLGTAKSRLESMRRKLGVSNRTEAVAEALRRGLIHRTSLLTSVLREVDSAGFEGRRLRVSG